MTKEKVEPQTKKIESYVSELNSNISIKNINRRFEVKILLFFLQEDLQLQSLHLACSLSLRIKSIFSRCLLHPLQVLLILGFVFL
jgi:hypothetical protein